jgi:hypothetical protein
MSVGFSDAVATQEARATIKAFSVPELGQKAIFVCYMALVSN